MNDPLGEPEYINVVKPRILRPRLTKAEKAAGFAVPELYKLQDGAWVRKRPPTKLKVKDLLSDSGMRIGKTRRALGTWEGNKPHPASVLEVERAHVPAGTDGLVLYEVAVDGHGTSFVKQLLAMRGWPTATDSQKKLAAEMLHEEMNERALSPGDFDVQSATMEEDVLERSRLALRRGRAHDRVRADDIARTVVSSQGTNSVALHVADPPVITKGKKRTVKDIEETFGDRAWRTRELSEKEVADKDGLTKQDYDFLSRYSGYTEQDLDELAKPHAELKKSSADLEEARVAWKKRVNEAQRNGSTAKELEKLARLKPGRSKKKDEQALKEVEEVWRLRMQKSTASRKRLRAGSWDPEAARAADLYNATWELPLVQPAPHQMDELQVQSNLWMQNDEGSDLSMEPGDEPWTAADSEVVSGRGRPRKQVKTQALDAARRRQRAGRALADVTKGKPVRHMHSVTGFEEWITGENRGLVGADFTHKSVGDEPTNDSSVHPFHLNASLHHT